MKEYHLQRAEELGLPIGTGKRYSAKDIKSFITASALHKTKLQELDELKMDAMIARLYHYAMYAEAVVGSAAVIASLPLTIEDLIPRWLTIAMAGGGLLVGPTALHETQITQKWLQETQKQVADHETIN